MGRPDEARGWIDRARLGHEERLRTHPEAAAGHALEHFLESGADPEFAVRLAEKNRDLRPGAEAHLLLARDYRQAGRHEDAATATTVVERILTQ